MSIQLNENAAPEGIMQGFESNNAGPGGDNAGPGSDIVWPELMWDKKETLLEKKT